jgi:arginase family enzyme
VATVDDCEELRRAKVIVAIGEVVGDGPACLTFAVDGLDPTEAPGTGVPEPGGPSMRDSRAMLRAPTRLGVVGGGVREVGSRWWWGENCLSDSATPRAAFRPWHEHGIARWKTTPSPR